MVALSGNMERSWFGYRDWSGEIRKCLTRHPDPDPNPDPDTDPDRNPHPDPDPDMVLILILIF